MRRLARLLPLVVVALGGAACVDDGGGDELVGVMWVVTGFVDGDRAVELERPQRDGFLQFEPEGFVTGHDGCNGFGYTTDTATGESDGLAYDIGDGAISYEGGAMTQLQGCLEQEYEDRFRAILSGPVEYMLDGDTLTITSPAGRGVVFVADG